MSIEAKNTTCSLEELEIELNSLLSKIHPKSVLSIGDTFKVTRDTDVLTYGKIKKGSKVEILEIIDGENEHSTIVINFVVKGDEDNIIKMSSGVFMVNFCDKIEAESKDVRIRISHLKNEIEDKKKKLKKAKAECLTEEVKEEVNWIIKLLKRAKKRLK